MERNSTSIQLCRNGAFSLFRSRSRFFRGLERGERYENFEEEARKFAERGGRRGGTIGGVR